MTTTEPVWESNDPYAGWELPVPPPWLPDAGDAVRGAANASAAAGGMATAHAETEVPPEGDGDAGPVLLTKEPPNPSPAPAAAPVAPAPAPVSSAALPERPSVPPPSGPPAPTTPAEPSRPPGPLEPSGPPESAEPEEDSEDSEDWGFVPLGVADPEAASVDEPRYSYSDPDEPAHSSGEFAYDRPFVGSGGSGGGLPGQHWFEDDTRRRPLPLIALGASLVVLVVVIALIVASNGGGGGKPAAKPPSGPSLASQAMPTEAVGARPVPSEQAAELRPQAVAVGVFGGELQVTWDPPRSPQAVSGYFVVAQTTEGRVEERRLVEKGTELTVVFDDADLCVVVTTVVSTLDGLQLARGDLVCPPAPTTTRRS